MADPMFPQDYLQMNDIYLWSTSLVRENEYQDAVHIDRVAMQTRQSVRVELLDAQLEGGDEVSFVRFLVSFALRAIFDEKDGGEPTLLHMLEATFAVEYVVKKEFTDSQLDEFCKFNCFHNAWPFWRQHVYDTLKRASLPMIVVPLFPGRPSSEKKPRRSSVKNPKSAGGARK